MSSDYDDCHWKEPEAFGQNGDQPLELRPHINLTAKWVWLSQDVDQIFCRLHLDGTIYF